MLSKSTSYFNVNLIVITHDPSVEVFEGILSVDGSVPEHGLETPWGI